MSEKSSAFFTGGCGCLAAFGVFAVLALMLGGHANIDPGGAVMLFIIGGFVGLIANGIYNKGRRDQWHEDHWREDQEYGGPI